MQKVDDESELFRLYSKIEHGWLSNSVKLMSRHYNARPADTIIDLLVIHCASLPLGEYDNNNLEQLFCGTLSSENLISLGLAADLKVSTHLYITRSGKAYQFVSFDERAWHAGISMYNGRTGCNDFSIGIELQGTDNTEFTIEQYNTLVAISKSILFSYPSITKESIVGHEDIAPGRKTDPGEKFDWPFYLSRL